MLPALGVLDLPERPRRGRRLRELVGDERPVVVRRAKSAAPARAVVIELT